jgi:hypothetical protein
MSTEITINRDTKGRFSRTTTETLRVTRDSKGKFISPTEPTGHLWRVTLPGAGVWTCEGASPEQAIKEALEADPANQALLVGMSVTRHAA